MKNFYITCAFLLLSFVSMEPSFGAATSEIAEHPVELRIYDGFSQVRREVNTTEGLVTFVFHQDDFQSIQKDSLDLEAPAKTRISLFLTEHKNSFEGKRVHVRNDRTGESREAILVDDEDSLVQDVITKRFYYATQAKLEYESKPMKNIVKATFRLHNPPKSAILTYVDRSISWSTKYRLDVDELTGTTEIKCFAVVSNPGKHEYGVRSAELFGGDTSSIAHGSPPSAPSMMIRTKAEMLGAAAMDMPNNIEISSGREIGGLFQYKIPQAFRLMARSDYQVEFIEPNVTTRFWSAVEVVNPAIKELRFDRFYEITSDLFLPAGKLSVRGQGRLLADSYIDNVPAGKAHKIRIGYDSSGFAVRNETSVVKDGDVSETTIEVKIRNLRDRPWEYRYQETNSRYDLDSSFHSKDERVKTEGNVVKITTNMKANDEEKFEFVLRTVKKRR